MTQLSIASSAPHDTIMDGEGYISPILSITISKWWMQITDAVTWWKSLALISWLTSANHDIRGTSVEQ